MDVALPPRPHRRPGGALLARAAQPRLAPRGPGAQPAGRFLALTAAGSFAWNALLVGLGGRLGESWPAVGPYYRRAEWAVWALVVAALAWRLARNRRAEAQQKKEDLGARTPARPR